MFILKKGHQPGVYVPLRALFLVFTAQLQYKYSVQYNMYCFQRLNFLTLASRFESNLVRNHVDRFAPNKAHISLVWYIV